MARIISEGLLPPDHPIFSGGLETFSIQKSKKSKKSSQPNSGEEIPAKSNSAKEPTSKK